MLTNNIENDPLYMVIKEVVEPLGYNLVDVQVKNGATEVNVSVTISNKDGVGLEDCSKASRILLTILTNYYDNRDVNLEVSSPGLTRHIKDTSEFNLFVGRNIRVYSLTETAYFHGTIKSYEEPKLIIKNVRKDESKNIIETVEIDYTDIKKAQLEEIN